MGGMVLWSCKPAATPPAPKVARTNPVPKIEVEIRPDGLAYPPGAATPFTGAAIVPFDDDPAKVKLRTPYTNGKLDGDKLELYKNGVTKTLRRYDKGLPKYASAYYRNGQIKFELFLNANDRGEGPYKRWYPDGTVESTSSFDSEERWHGEMKEWSPKGVLKNHIIMKHGLLERSIYEDPETLAIRLENEAKQKNSTTPEPEALKVSKD